jgi:MFS family permease
MAAARPTSATGRPFYGWIIVAVMAVIGCLSMALGSLNFGLFVKPIGDELGIGRAVFGWAQTTRQVASAVTAPLVGGLIDRFGSRLLLTLAAVITGGALIGLAFINQGWQLVLLFTLMGIVGLSGPGALILTVPVGKWFVRRRGTAFALMSIGAPIGGLLFVPLTQLFIDAYGWRLASALLALIGAGLTIPLALIFVRRQPEDMGLQPDGEPIAQRPPPGDQAAAQPAAGGGRTIRSALPLDEHSWTRAAALRTPAFWRLVIAFSLIALGVTAVGFHRIPSFMDRGLDARLISIATALDAGASGLSTFAMGMLARRIASRYIGAAGFFLLALAGLLTILVDDHPLLFLSMIIFGFGIGIMILSQGLLWADYFGRRHLGSIQGAVQPLTLIFGGAGAPVAGYVHDLTGSYTMIWLVAVGLMLLAAILLAVTPPPRLPAD